MAKRFVQKRKELRSATKKRRKVRKHKLRSVKKSRKAKGRAGAPR